jgi:hypothetical protein
MPEFGKRPLEQRGFAGAGGRDKIESDYIQFIEELAVAHSLAVVFLNKRLLQL